MRKLTKLERFKDKVLSRYDVYNNVFLTLPFESINDTGRLLPLFSKYCVDGFNKDLSPLMIVDGFFNEYCNNQYNPCLVQIFLRMLPSQFESPGLQMKSQPQ